jgi:mannose/fructose/N-acetylgalactosamine-specific phosphotransferase system component IIB
LDESTIIQSSATSWAVPQASVVSDFNTALPDAPFSEDGTDTYLTSPTAGVGGSVAVNAPIVSAEQDRLAPLFKSLGLCRRVPAPNDEYLFLLSSITGTFEPGEAVDINTGAGTAQMLLYLPAALQMRVRNPTALGMGVPVVGLLSGATATLVDYRVASDDVSTDDTRYLKITVADPSSISGVVVDGNIAADTYDDAATLAAAVQVALDNPHTYIDVTADDDSNVVITTVNRGSVEWAQADDETPAAELLLFDNAVEHGKDVARSRLEMTLQEQSLPLGIVPDTSTTIRDILVYVSDALSGAQLVDDYDIAVGDRLGITRVATDTILVGTIAGSWLVGQQVSGVSAPDTATGTIREIITVGSDFVLRLDDMSGLWLAGMAATSSGGGTGVIQQVPGDGTGPAAYTVVDYDDTADLLTLDRLPREGYYLADVTREVLGVKSQDTSLGSAIQVQAGPAATVLGFSTTEQRGTTDLIEIDGVSLDRVVRPRLRRGDSVIGFTTDLEIRAILTDDNYIRLSSPVPNDSDVAVQVFALGAVPLDVLQQSLDTAWETFQKSRMASGTTRLSQALEQAYKSPRWVHEYRNRLSEYSTLLTALRTSVQGYTANIVVEVQQVLSDLVQNKLTAARDTLVSCRLKEFLDLNLEEASYWALALKSIGDFMATMPMPADAEDLDGYLEADDRLGAGPGREDFSNTFERRTEIQYTDDDEEDGVYGA